MSKPGRRLSLMVSLALSPLVLWVIFGWRALLGWMIAFVLTVVIAVTGEAKEKRRAADHPV